MGYATNEVFSTLPGNTGIENSLAIEFDMWDNTGGWDDFNSSKNISVQTNGTQANRPSAAFSRGQVSPLADFGDGAVHTVRLSYAPGILDIYLDNLVTPILTVNVDLATTLALHNGSDAFVGFTAPLGGAPTGGALRATHRPRQHPGEKRHIAAEPPHSGSAVCVSGGRCAVSGEQ